VIKHPDLLNPGAFIWIGGITSKIYGYCKTITGISKVCLMTKVAVLIPCYNEDNTIRKVIADYRRALPEAYIYIYDNNSTDRTAEIVSELAKNDDRIILRREYRQGKGNVIRSMFRDIDADCYLMVDGDDTYPAEDAPIMTGYVLSGQADMVVGDRLSSTYFSENKRQFHSFGNVLIRQLINSLFKTDIHDIMTGYRAFSRSFVKGFPILSHGFEIETEMTIHAVDRNYLIKEITVQYRDRPEGSVSKLDTYRDGLKVLKTVFELFKNYRPFFFFGVMALMFGIVAAGLFIPVLAGYVETGLVLKFPTLIVSGVMSICSLLSFSAGVILDVEIKKYRQLYEILMNSFVSRNLNEKHYFG